MVRTQIQLTEEQAERLKRRASERGVSMAALIREAVEELLAGDVQERRRGRALDAVGRFRSGHDDIAREHDKYLAEDFR